MKPNQSKGALRKRLGGSIDSLTAGHGITAMLEFYATQRAEGVASNGGDMLLFQWGIATAEPAEFYLNITRQFILADEDEPYHLSLSLSTSLRLMR
jgi:hypothetical protein